MPRRKSPYPDKPYTPSDDARRRIATLMPEKDREKVLPPEPKSQVPRPRGELWRWDDLTDVDFD